MLINKIKKVKNKKFELKEKPSFVSVVFYRKNFEKQIENGKKVPNSTELNLNEKKILEYLQINKQILSEVLEKLLGIKERRARKILSKMAKKSFLLKIGKTKGSYYILKENNI